MTATSRVAISEDARYRPSSARVSARRKPAVRFRSAARRRLVPACRPGRHGGQRRKRRRSGADRLFLRIEIEARAAVCTISNARLPSGEIQTPSRVSGCAWPAKAPSSRSISPVGSAGMLCLATMPMSELSNCTSLSNAACKRGHAEMPRHDGRTEQIAIAPQQIAIARERCLVAIAHDAECRVRSQPAGHRLAERRQRVGRRALDRQQDQARDNALVQLIDQDLLRRRRRARQEGRHVGTELGPRDDDAAGKQKHSQTAMMTRRPGIIVRASA